MDKNTPQWNIRLQPETKQQIQDFLQEISISQTQTQSQTSQTKQEELEKERQKLFGKPLSKEEAIQKQKQKKAEWYYDEITNSIIGPDGVIYSGAPYDTPEFREQVEKQSPPIDTSQLVTTGRLIQHVKVIPGEIEVVFCTLCAAEVHWLQRQQENAKNNFSNVFQARLNDLFAAIRQVSGSKVTGDKALILPDPLQYDPQRQQLIWNEEQFKSNLDTLYYKLPQNVVMILLTQYWWFRSRVDEFLLPTNLGNS